jgi:hypothetical protein
LAKNGRFLLKLLKYLKKNSPKIGKMSIQASTLGLHRLKAVAIQVARFFRQAQRALEPI